MVKGITKQVIVVRSLDPQLFEQAIFILKEDAVREGITEEMLLKEAKQAVNRRKKPQLAFGPLWACAGAGVTGLAWRLTSLI